MLNSETTVRALLVSPCRHEVGRDYVIVRQLLTVESYDSESLGSLFSDSEPSDSLSFQAKEAILFFETRRMKAAAIRRPPTT